MNDHLLTGSLVAKHGFVDSGTTFTYLPKRLWESVLNHFDIFCEKGKNFTRKDGQKKYCHGARFQAEAQGERLQCFHYDKNYFEGPEGPGRKHFFLGYPMIRLLVQDKEGNSRNITWLPSEYLYYEPTKGAFCLAADVNSRWD